MTELPADGGGPSGWPGCGPWWPRPGPTALLVTTLANIRYLTGFTGSAALLLVTGDEALLVTDGRYRTQAAEQLDGVGPGRSVELVVGGAQVQRARRRRSGRRAGVRVGLEAENVTWGSQAPVGRHPGRGRDWWPPPAWWKDCGW